MTYTLKVMTNFKAITMRCNPDEPVLKKEKEDPRKVLFLGLSTDVHDRKFTIFFFPFHISHIPHLDSNTPSKIFYASVGSGI